jgi:uroporphyrinogen decarboxylase
VLTDHERFLNVMSYKPVDRCVYGVWTGGWPETIERWKKEGYDPSREPLFKTDHWEWQGGWFHPDPPFEYKVISEDEHTILHINHEGILMRERKDYPKSSRETIVDQCTGQQAL